MNKRHWSHYDWLEEHFPDFAEKAGSGIGWRGNVIAAHGDKVYQYKDIWAAANIPFAHGAAIYLLTYIHPFTNEVRDTTKGFIPPQQWVIDNYNHFKQFLTTDDLEKIS